MDDLYLLLVMVVITSVGLYFLRITLWWIFAIAGILIYLILSMMVNRSVQMTSKQLEVLKEDVGKYLYSQV